MFKRSFDGGNFGKIPLGIKIISIIHYIIAAFYIFPGVFMIIKPNNAASSLISVSPELNNIMTTGIAILMGVFFIGLGIFAIIVGIGLWRLKNWTKIVAIIFAIVLFLSSIISIVFAFNFRQILWLIVGGFIAGYLLFNKKSKVLFK